MQQCVPPHMHIEMLHSQMTHVPLYVGVVDSSVVQVVAERCDHQSQDLQIVQVILWGGGGIETTGCEWWGLGGWLK